MALYLRVAGEISGMLILVKALKASESDTEHR